LPVYHYFHPPVPNGTFWRAPQILKNFDINYEKIP